MDLWVVGAAAAAGYIAKYWQHAQKESDNISESGPSKHEKQDLHSRPFHRRFIGKKKNQTEEVSTTVVGRISNVYMFNGVSEEDECSSVYAESPGTSGNWNFLNMLEDKFGLTSKIGGDSSWICTGQVDLFRESTKKRSLRTKNGQSIKPLTAVESCLLAQLYQEHSEMEEYMLSVNPSKSTTTRTLLVTDGNQIISRAARDSVSLQIDDNDKLLKEVNVRGVVLPLPKVSPLDALNKIKKGPHERLKSPHKSGSGKGFISEHGSPDQTLLFSLGISVGIIASLISSGREMDKLKDQLKQRENLVQDLQEELEMKDSLTVKELADENSGSQGTSEKRDNSTSNDGKESKYGKAGESSEDMSKIEAELEAELERLGLHVSTSVKEGKLSGLVELDPDYMVDFAQGELREDLVKDPSVGQPELDKDASCTTRTPSGNYTVSPRELSLRLHEVIESRLEEQVKNLEQALQNTERKLRLMESQHNNIQRKLSGSRLRYSSGEQSPVSEEDSQPLVMNLSGEALDAYNEACEELMKENESEEDSSPGSYRSNSRGNSTRNGPMNGSLTRLIETRERAATDLYAQSLIGNGRGVRELVYDGVSEGENSDVNEEMELIKQIVEQTRKGSPAVLNAQKMLFSIDEL